MPFIGNTPQTQSFAPAVDYFSGNGVTVTFTLSRPVVSVAQLTVAVDNVIQNPSSAFTVSGNSITFTSAPLSGTNNIWVEYTSLITTYAAISQDPSVIGDITATGGFLAEGDFGNSYIDGTIVDYVTGNARITTGPIDDMTFYHGGTSGRSEMMKLSYAGNSTLTGNLAISGSATIQGLTVGKGGGNVATNTVVGYQAANSNTTGRWNTAIGYQAAYSNTTGEQQVAVGRAALFANTTGAEHTAVGHGALASNTTGNYSSAFGNSALSANTTGSNNVAVGYSALVSNTTATRNTAVGYQAGYALTTGGANVVVGDNAFKTATTADNTVAIGTYALENTTGIYNTAVGAGAGGAITTGAKNSILGRYNGNQGGLDIRTASNYIVLSDGDGNPRYYIASSGNFFQTGSVNGDVLGTFTNTNASSPYGLSMVFNSAAPNNVNNFFYYGGDNTNARFVAMSNGGIKNYSANNVNLSDQSVKKDIQLASNYLDKICAIPVKTFLYVDQTDTEKNLGVIAQDVKAVAPELTTEVDWGTKDEPNIKLSVYESDLMFALMKSIQELKAEVDSLKAQLEAK